MFPLLRLYVARTVCGIGMKGRACRIAEWTSIMVVTWCPSLELVQDQARPVDPAGVGGEMEGS
jgi:hypothetical protein